MLRSCYLPYTQGKVILLPREESTKRVTAHRYATHVEVLRDSEFRVINPN
jgi:hypothetical protein